MVDFIHCPDQLGQKLIPHIKSYLSHIILIFLITPLPAMASISLVAELQTDEFHQSHKVSGKVTDFDTGEGLPGVSIVVKGTNNGTTSAIDGTFEISAEDRDILIFSFVGFKPFETLVGSLSNIDVSMKTDVISLSEVEVRSTGYWTDAKATSVGNIAKVESKEIQDQPVTNPLMAIQGRMAGVDVSPANGIAGSAIKIQIRGQNSLRFDGGYPLFIVDGVPIDSRPIASGNSGLLQGRGFDPLSSINPNNIQSIEVLKDADATSIYGSRGANGVVLITTKNGTKIQKSNIDIGFYKGIGYVNKIDLLNTNQYLEMRREAFRNDNIMPKGVAARDILIWDSTRYTDWQKELFGNAAQIMDAQASISGGNQNTSFRFSGGYHEETMVFPGDFGFNRITGTLSVNHISDNQKLKISLSTNYGSDNNSMFDDGNYISEALSLPPNAPPLYDGNGTLNWENFTNPFSYLRKTHDSQTDNLIANSNLIYNLTSALSVRANLGYSILASNEIIKNPLSANNPANNTPTSVAASYFGSNDRKSWIVEPQIVYSNKFGEMVLDAVIGTTFQNSVYKSQLVYASGYSSDALLSTIKGSTSTSFVRDDSFIYKYLASFGRIGLKWKEKYLLNVTGRRDGSSRFGPGNRFGNFGSIGGGWIFSNESILRDQSIISFGKIRTSYGVTGNDQIGDYKYFDTYSVNQYTYQGAVNLSPTALFNNFLAWEKTRKFEIGFEIGLFDDKIMFEASRYSNRSSNQLVQYPLAETSGFKDILINLDATVENSGWEYVLNLNNPLNRMLKWNAAINLSVPKNKLLSFPNLEESSYASFYTVGKPVTIAKTYKFNGVNPEKGLYTFEDVDSDNDIDDDDRKVDKFIGRHFFGGFMNEFTLGAFNFSFLIQFVKQSSVDFSSPTTPGMLANQPVKVMDRWQGIGQTAEVQRFGQLLFGENNTRIPYFEYRTSDRSISNDASFVRLKTLSLSYHLRSIQFIKNTRGDFRLYIQCQNIVTLTKYKGLDPETGSSVLPPLKVISAGLQVKL